MKWKKKKKLQKPEWNSLSDLATDRFFTDKKVSPKSAAALLPAHWAWSTSAITYALEYC